MKLRFISPKVHGIVDYLTAATLPCVARYMGFDKTVTHLHDGVAGMIGTLAATTDFEPGLIKAVPMKAHLMIDGITGAALLGVAAMMDEEDCSARACTSSVGAFLILQALCTRTRTQNKPQVDNSGRQSPMQRYAAERRPEAAEYSGAMG